MQSLFPLYSQHLDVPVKKWKTRSCGIVALKTVMDFWEMRASQRRVAGFSALINDGEKIGAYIPHVGWRHKGLVQLARKNGFTARNYDDNVLTDRAAFSRLQENLLRGPVIVSIHRNLNLKNHGHLVVVIKTEKGVVFYLDPDSRSRSGIMRKVAVQKFVRGWKRRIITVRLRRLRKKR